MNFRESVGIALEALRANKLRSFLTLVGVIIGVSSVIAVMSLVQGLNQYVTTQFASAGANVFSVDKVGLVFDPNVLRERARRRDLTIADAEAIRRAAVHVESVTAERTAIATARRGRHSLSQVTVRGVQGDYMRVNDLPIALGRPLGGADDDGRAAACVLGADVADHLFSHADPLGHDVRVGSRTMRVVGVGTPKGTAFGASQDLYVLVPLQTFTQLFGRQESVSISVRSTAQGTFAQAQDEVRAIVRMRRHVRPGAPDDFEIVTPEMYMSIWSRISGAIFVVIVGVSAISLLVGGIVIMNIMLVSVTERTREIGIRMALGARRRDILAQFMIEATTLSSVGGAIGLGLGVAATLLVGAVTPLPTYLSMTAVAVSLVTAVGVGVFFGAWPATRAARQDPIAALRHE